MANWTEDVVESGTLTDALLFERASHIIEAATASDTLVPEPFNAITETTSAVDVFAPSTLRTRNLVESAQARDVASVATTVLVVETAASSDATVTSASNTLVETASASEQTTASTTRVGVIVETLRATDVAAPGAEADVVESLTASDVVAQSYAAFVVESVTASDEHTVGSSVDADDLVELATASDEVTTNVVTNALVADTLTAQDTVSIKSPGAVAWVMNAETGAPSWYSNFQFVDTCQVGNTVLAVGPDGLFTLSGDTDNGDEIDAGVTWGFNEFGGYDRDGSPKDNVFKKRVTDIFIGYTSDDTLEATVETYGQGEPVYTYTMERRSAEQPINSRIKPGMGLSARYWRIGINNVGGCDFSVDSIIAHAAQTVRRL